MSATVDRADARSSDPERVGLAWVAVDRAVIVRWDGEPTLEHLYPAVLPKRRAVGSVRRGPARPSGGGRVSGHGNENRHEQDIRRFLTDVVGRLSDLEEVEIVGRGRHQERVADLLRRLAARRGAELVVTTRARSRRPSDNQLQAGLRKLVGAELPRRQVGRYRAAAPGPTTETGRPLEPAAGRRTLRPPRLPEWREINEEVESMLADEPWDQGAD